MQVINIPSSPEPSGPPMTRRARSASRQPGPSKKRPRLARTARKPSGVEIIELSDSDDNLPAHQRPSKVLRSQPGDVTTSNGGLTFGKPNSGILADIPAAQPGPSQHVTHQEQQGDDVPLFLPGSDDGQHVVDSPSVPVARDVPDVAPAYLQPPEPATQAPAPVDPIDEYVVRVLEIVPDVQPTYALTLIEQIIQTQPGNVVEFVLHALFENPSYPKADKKGKHKRDEPDSDPNVKRFPKPKVDYTSKERAYNCGPHYFECSLEQLMLDFPRIPKPHIRSRLFDNRFYAPTYLLLAEELKKEPPPFKLKSTNSIVGKGKGKARQDPEFENEREWVLLKVAELAAEGDAALAAAVNEQQYEENGEGIECGCCFSEYPFDQIIQCPEAHLFCKSCMTSYASNLLGEHNPNIVCMDQSGCKLPFPESELGRFLSPKLLELYYRVKQRKEIEAAGLENLEECPFCEYKCVIENETEKLFRCENASCSAITCRACKKPDHLPKSCKEAEEDKHLDAQHVIEEAMTQALMRSCPKCQKSFIKEMGCNKMTCPNCHTMSCYICRKIIVGYDHFSNPPPYGGKVDKSKCNLWDPVEQRHAEEVSEAAKRALVELRRSRPDVDESNLKVDIPVTNVPPRPGVAPRQAVHVRNGGAAWPAYMGGDAARMEALAARMGMDIGAGAGAGMGMGVRIGVPNGMGGVAGAGMGAGAFNGMGGVAGGGMGMGAGIGALNGMVGVAGAGMDMGAGVGAPNGMGVGGGDPFWFGAGRAHQFVAPAFGAPPRPGVGPPAPAHGAVIPEPPIPLALARGRRAPRAQPIMAAGGGGRQRKGR